MNIKVVVLMVSNLILSVDGPGPAVNQNPVSVTRYPPAWTTAELNEADKRSLLGYCVEEGKRCGHTNIMGGLGDRYVYCCPGLWCSPDPKTSKDLYTRLRTFTTKTDFETESYYEYPYEKFFCKRDDFYPELPIDYSHDSRWDHGEVHFPDEN